MIQGHKVDFMSPQNTIFLLLYWALDMTCKTVTEIQNHDVDLMLQSFKIYGHSSLHLHQNCNIKKNSFVSSSNFIDKTYHDTVKSDIWRSVWGNFPISWFKWLFTSPPKSTYFLSILDQLYERCSPAAPAVQHHLLRTDDKVCGVPRVLICCNNATGSEWNPANIKCKKNKNYNPYRESLFCVHPKSCFHTVQ